MKSFPNVRTYLSQMFTINKRIEAMLDEAKFLRNMSDKVSRCDPTNTRVTNGRSLNPIQNAISDLDELERDIAKEVKALKREWQKIQQAIEKLPGKQKLILSRRYLLCETWDDIVENTGYSLRTVHNIHIRALENLKPLVEKG